ncbi:hypothetical protein B0T24DRAFT_599072 [Lasiosphaeria ovina]|uniref:Uncharacterized protein n=1 Tax=Lasiosphaeria ovina TaxID=92902 RepID=A0AAE0JUL6_9PEZI|nr:hypothetical protein B0T24DRAFT_599072 [Lasiosphaeria ovina]
MTTFTAFTIVTIINTINNTTRLSTVFKEPPENFTMPSTNSDGTRISTVTFERFGTRSTTVLSDGTFEHIRKQDHLFFPIMSNPQPTGENIFDRKVFYNLIKDPFGMNFTLVKDIGSEYAPYDLVKSLLFNDQAPIQSCDAEGHGPFFGNWGQSHSWLIHSTTSTSYEGFASGKCASGKCASGKFARGKFAGGKFASGKFANNQFAHYQFVNHPFGWDIPTTE